MLISYRNSSEEKKRDLVKSLVENFSWGTKNDHKTLVIIWKTEFQIVANRTQYSTGGAELIRWKTAMALVSQIYHTFVNSSSNLALRPV